MTKEELLAEAKRRYPIGTKYKSTSGNINTVESMVWPNSGQDDVIWAESGKGILYDRGKWAEIIESPKPQFIPGKWYKANTFDNKVYYIKFKRLEKRTDYNQLYGETISNNGLYTNSDISGWANTDFENQALKHGPLTDLTEIQQYLPHGHPDKIIVSKELTELPEKWCIKVEGDYSRSLEVYKWRGFEWYDSGYICNNSDKEWFNIIPGGYTEITFDQFKKWVLKEEKTMDKIEVFPGIYVGDVVVSLKLRPDTRRYGDILKVLEKSHKGTLYYNSSTCSDKSSEWRKATKEEEEAYSKGIRNISEIISKITKLEEGKYYYVNWMYNDTKYIFKYINNHENKCINLLSNTYYNNGSFNSPQNWKEIRFATKEEQEWLDRCISTDKFVPKEEIKKSLVGRYLKALVDRPDGGSVKKGEVGKIIIITIDGIPNTVNFPSQSNYSVAKTTYEQGSYYELMPEGFTPEQEKKYVDEAVHCKTQEEWDFVNSKLESHLKLPSSTWSSYKERQAKCLNKGQHCSIDWYSKNGYKVYSFEEWCTKFNHKMGSKSSNLVCGVNLIPREVYSAVQDTGTHWIMRFYNLLKDDSCINSSSVNLASKNFYKENTPYWGSKTSIKSIRLATPEEKVHFEDCEKAGKYVDAPNKEENVTFEVEIISNELGGNWYKIGEKYTIYASESKLDRLVYFNHPTNRTYWISADNCKIINTAPKMESILEEAKKRYPIGTEIKPLNSNYIYNTEPIIISSYTHHIHTNCIDENEEEIWFTAGKYGVTVYSKGKWCDKVYSPKQEEKWVPKVGDWVVGWHATSSKYSNIPWKIIKINSFSGEKYAVPEEGYSTGIERLRKAKPHEIPSYPDTSTKGLIDPNLVKEMVDFSDQCSIKPTDAQISREVSVDLYVSKGNDTLDPKVTRSRPVTIDLKKESKVLLF